MRTLKFHYAGAWNFLPFGPEGIELHFDKLGNIIFVRGENLDVKPLDNNLALDEVKISSNGTGKSTLQEILCWTFYGQTIKAPKKIKIDDVIHNLVGKKCKTCVIVDKYKIERGRAPNFLRLWESEKHDWIDAGKPNSNELTTGDMRVTQKTIIDKVIGLSYEAFCNICVFTDDQSSCFLECDGPTKREIVENLMSLAVYRLRHTIASDEQKVLKSSIKSLSREYEIVLGTKADAERRVEQAIQKEKDWKEARIAEAKKLVEQVKEKMKSLQATDKGAGLLAYQKAQEAIKTITPKIEALEAAQETRRRVLSEVKLKEHDCKEEARKVVEKAQESQRSIKDNQAKIKEKRQVHDDLSSKQPGTRCGHCFSIIDEANSEHVCKDISLEIDSYTVAINAEMAVIAELNGKITTLKQRQDRIKKALADDEAALAEGEVNLRKLRSELVTASQVREPKADSAELLLQQQIEELKNRARAKKAEADGHSPFVDILANDKVELAKIIKTCEEKEIEVKSAEKLIPYYDYWLKAYGDKGIRKWVIDGIVPALNSRIAYWLQFLIDNKITIKFDNELNEVIERNPPDGDPYIYHAMSAGQRRRINLAVSQAFAHIMMISTGTVPSLVFLDEVTTNIDPLGVQGIYNMIGELAEEKQVFITTHDADLIRMLQGTDVVSLRHENGITRMV